MHNTVTDDDSEVVDANAIEGSYINYFNSTMNQSSIIDFGAVTKWSCSDVSNWLRLKDHDDQYILLFNSQKIDGKSLLLMTENDLRQAPLSINVLGDLKRLYFDILELQQSCSMGMGCGSLSSSLNHPYLPFSSLFITPDSGYRPLSTGFLNSNQTTTTTTAQHSSHSLSQKRLRRRKRKVSFVETDSSQLSEDTADCDDDLQSQSDAVKESTTAPLGATGNGHLFQHSQHTNSLDKSDSSRRRTIRHASSASLEPEVGKAFVAMLYVFCVTWLTAVVMVIVHDRVPDMEKYPPLPDLFLDNMPHIPWAFEMCELTGTVLFCLFLGVLFFHKHRFILIRRFFALCGTVFSLRCFTMLITSLSVPGAHLKCNPRPYGDWPSRLYNAYLIWKGAGMSIQGVRTCGDYMFSGHTVALTMLNFFVTEYTTRRLYFIHTLSWLLNMFGIFFILAAHEHYSIDVFIAFYITSRLFLYYHTLANNQALMQRDSKRTKVWFPLFSYFESKVDGIVPNHYEWPITPKRLKRWCGVTLKLLESKWKEIIPHPNEKFFRLKVFFKPTVSKEA